MLQRDDGITIPVPPDADLLAFAKHSGQSLGYVLGWYDTRYRVLPPGSSVTDTVIVWNGAYLGIYPARFVAFDWVMGYPYDDQELYR